MARFYFTYGTEGQPYVGGWTEVEAPDAEIAGNLFKAVHPCKSGNILNCSWVYTEEQFKKTEMSGPGGNMGKRCVERITLTRPEEQ